MLLEYILYLLSLVAINGLLTNINLITKTVVEGFGIENYEFKSLLTNPLNQDNIKYYIFRILCGKGDHIDNPTPEQLRRAHKNGRRTLNRTK